MKEQSYQRYYHSGSKVAGIGAASLFDLHGRIVTLKETILYLNTMLASSNEDKIEQKLTKGETNSALSNLKNEGFDRGKVGQDLDLAMKDSVPSSWQDGAPTHQLPEQDVIKLQEEYSKLTLQKHKVWCRSFVIPEAFVGLSFQVHNGSKFVLLKITEKIVGYRFGEFVPTRKVTIHKEAKKKK